MIFVGNQTACWAATPNEPFDYALAQGFNAFEWFPDKKPGAGWDESDLSAGARQNIRDAARAVGMRLSVHARWQANPLSPESAPLLWKDLDLASELGATLLNVHLFHEQGLAAFVQALTPLIGRTGEAGLQLAIENTPDHSPEQFNELFALLQRVHSPVTRHVGMCLDLGHANLCAATRNDFLGFCDRLNPQVPVIHVHLHENWGDADTHMPLFTGPAAADVSGIRDFLARLRRRTFSGSMILEQWPHPPLLLNHARDRLLELWEATRAPAENAARHSHYSSASSRVGTGAANESEGEGKRAGAGPRTESQSGAPDAPGGDFAMEIIAGDQRCRSWREKLEFARSLLARKEPAPSAEQLIDVSIYLRFLGTGEISCVEDDRHFRPAHHARIAAEIQGRLAGLTTADNVWIVRKIYPWLPSSSPTFQRPEPLTRIRDIAHRNDIGQELKREIKATLQNKLHRCAGPEDLATSSALLQRITAPGANYPAAFVEQFRIFHDELKEFFNARSLEERLEALIPLLNSRLTGVIRQFLQEKTGGTPPNRLAALRTLTALRQGFVEALAPKPGPHSQEVLLADIGLEDFAFVLLSELCNDFEGSTAGVLSVVETLALAIENVALSGVEPRECGALKAELNDWGRISEPAKREELLRLKTTALRCRRLAEDFSARTVALLAGRVEKLGLALGVAQHAVRVFAESDIRAHNVFQLSKLVTNLLCRIREQLGLPGWDVIVSGRAVGRVKTLNSLDELSGKAETGPGDGPFIVLLNNAAGDEEVPPNVAGIILAQEIPHLSHLGVRARQAGIVFSACEEALEFERLKSSEGQLISFLAHPDKVSWESASKSDPVFTGAHRHLPRIVAANLVSGTQWIPLDQAVPENSGGKASGARRLAELSRRAGSGFSTPAGFVVPFGVMETALHASAAHEQEYHCLVKAVSHAPNVAAATEQLRELIQQLAVPEPIVWEAMRRFDGNRPLIVRSSATCEDVEEFAGAGLYESIINVRPSEVASAIRRVWASLWTARATLSRQNSGIPHEQADMGVLIQELLAPEFSFVLHTVNPIGNDAREVYAEIVVGLGETLASAATRGSPYRLVCDKSSGMVTTLAFANFSQASFPDPNGGLRRETVDYSRIDLSREADARSRLGRRLTAIACFIERAMQGPQDIEGAVVRNEIFLVQSRPQTGLPPRSSTPAPPAYA